MNTQDELDWLFPNSPDVKEIIRKVKNTPEGDDLNALHSAPKVKDPQVKTVPIGTYTVVVPGDSKPHRTIQVVPWKSRPGINIFQMLIGPDNGLDFLSFGQQEGTQSFRVWGSYRDREEWIQAANALVLIVSEGDLDMAGEMYALISERCRRCHHKLTVPASIHRGYGPDCAEAVGMA